jgi:hypothetical protein
MLPTGLDSRAWFGIGLIFLNNAQQIYQEKGGEWVSSQTPFVGWISDSASTAAAPGHPWIKQW